MGFLVSFRRAQNEPKPALYSCSASLAAQPSPPSPAVPQAMYLLEVGDLIQRQTLLLLDGVPQRLLHVLHQVVEGSRILQGHGDGTETVGSRP